jgi:hypothetical protein
MTGSIAANLHEGSRSEYLAQFAFSSFGTAIPVPHQEDSGIDIYCTLLERIGRRSWPRAYYSVQVKSTMRPWVFSGAQSVRWLIEHPLPIFLCIVKKAEARILVYNTTFRFAVWALPLHENRVEVIPGGETKAITLEWAPTAGGTYKLTAPILNFTIEQLLNRRYHAQVADVLNFWIGFDMENLFRIKCGLPHFRVPYAYETNLPKPIGGLSHLGGPFTEDTLQRAQDRLKELMDVITKHHHSKRDLVNAAIHAMALRHLSPEYKPGEFTPHDSFLHAKLNSLFGMEPPSYAYQACDSLLKMVRDELAGHGVTDSTAPAPETS